MPQPDPGKRLRIAHVTQSLAMGGLEKLLVEFARHGDRDEFDLCFVSLTRGGVLRPVIEACGWPVHEFHVPSGFRPGLMVQLAHFFWKNSIDVVHTHDDRPLVHSSLAVRLGAVTGAIHTRHGRNAGIRRRQELVIRLACRSVSHFVCVSHDSATVSRSQGLDATKVMTIWNGIDTGRYSFVGPQPGGPIVTVARLSREKGIDTLIRSAQQAVRRDHSIRFEIAGDGPCMGEARELVASLDLGGHVRLLGEVADVNGLLSCASCFVLPSRSEGISLTILEAMAKGLPVVATRVGGNCEVVSDSETGLLVRTENPSELVEAIGAIRADFSRAQRMGVAARRRVEEHFDVRAMIRKYEALYRDVCVRRGRLRHVEVCGGRHLTNSSYQEERQLA